MSEVHLTPKASKLVARGRPWLWRDDLKKDPAPPDGPELVRVRDADGRDVGLGFWSPASRLALRLCGDWEGDDVPDPATFFGTRVREAVARRADLAGANSGVRIIHGEGDGLPGLVADRFGGVVVLQIGSAVVERHLGAFVPALVDAIDPLMVLARDDSGVRKLEGLEVGTSRLLHGKRVDEVWIEEDGVEHVIDPWTGQKTAFYLDQRPARTFVRTHANDRHVLDVFGYQGAFSLNALKGGARTSLLVDQSAGPLQRAERGAERNQLSGLETREGNAFDILRELRKAERQFGLVIVDPPAFAKSRRERDDGLRGYRELNRTAIRLLEPGGLLVTCTCSHHVDLPSFEQVVRQAATGVPFRITLRERLGAGPDHPVWLALPESEYLKVLVLERQV